LLRTEKSKRIAAAATPIAITGSQTLDKKGSAGILPFVNGNELFSNDSNSSTFTVSIAVMKNCCNPLLDDVFK
jgi:hypothetical protein